MASYVGLLTGFVLKRERKKEYEIKQTLSLAHHVFVPCWGLQENFAASLTPFLSCCLFLSVCQYNATQLADDTDV